jgi:hypothetical protein
VVFRTSHFGIVRKAVICSALMLTGECVLAASEFTFQRRVGYTSGDQWEPVLATDARAHIYILFPQYGPIAQCPVCTAPTMALSTSNDDGVSWDAPRPLLTSSSGQFDAQIKVDPVDRETLYASWLQAKHDVIVGRSQFRTGARSRSPSNLSRQGDGGRGDDAPTRGSSQSFRFAALAGRE